MKKLVRFFAVMSLVLSILACNFSTDLLKPQVAQPVNETVLPTAYQPEVTEVPVDPNAPTPTTEPTPVEESEAAICSLVNPEDVEIFLNSSPGEPATDGGNCTYIDAKEGLYSVTLSAAQEKDIPVILREKITLITGAGIIINETTTTKLSQLADSGDYKGYLSELVTVSKGSQQINAKLFKGGGNDLTFWTWGLTSPSRTGSFLAVRGKTMVGLTMVVPESQEEKAMLTAANNLAGKIFSQLPAEFSFMKIDQPEENPVQAPAGEATQPAAPSEDQTTPSVESTGKTPAAVVPSSPDVPVLISPADGTEINIYPRTITLTWAPVEGASKYLVEIMACSQTNPDTCFSHPMIEQTTRETASTTYTFNFVGKQPGKWRVSIFDASGKLGTPSPWWKFTCLQ